MKDTDKITMTLGQLKKLVSEAKKYSNLDDWKTDDAKLKSTKKTLAKDAKELYEDLMAEITFDPLYEKLLNKLGKKFSAELTKKFVDSNISYHADSPREAAENLWFVLAGNDSLTVPQIVEDMYLYSE